MCLEDVVDEDDLNDDLAASPTVLKQVLEMRWRTKVFLEEKVWAQTEQMMDVMATVSEEEQRKTDRGTPEKMKTGGRSSRRK